MIFTLAAMAAAFVGGGVVTAGSWKAFVTIIEAKAVAEKAVLAADVKAELAKVAPDLAALKAKVTALLVKVGL